MIDPQKKFDESSLESMILPTASDRHIVHALRIWFDSLGNTKEEVANL